MLTGFFWMVGKPSSALCQRALSLRKQNSGNSRKQQSVCVHTHWQIIPSVCLEKSVNVNSGYVKREKDTSAILPFPSAICMVNIKMMLCLQRSQAKIQSSVFLLNSNTWKKKKNYSTSRFFFYYKLITMISVFLGKFCFLAVPSLIHTADSGSVLAFLQEWSQTDLFLFKTHPLCL